jgi:hypothetical protein
MANLSSVITQTVGASAGGVNVIASPNTSASWGTTSLLTLSTTSTVAELPLQGAANSAVKFALVGSATSAYLDFFVPTALLNTKLILSWYARASVSTIGSATLSLSSFASEVNRSSNTSPTVISLPTSSVATAAQQFATSFDANSQQYYRMTISFPSAASQWYSVAQVVAGIGTLEQGAAVSDAIAFTPSSSQGFGTLGAIRMQYRRIGSFMGISGWFQVGTPTATQARFGLPSGFTIGTYSGSSLIAVAGKFDRSIGTATTVKQGTVLATTGNTYVTFGLDDYTTAVLPDASQNGNAFSTTSETIYVAGEWLIPIAEWAGNGTVNLGPGAQVEYAYNSSATTTTDTTSFAYGPTGANFTSMAPAGTSVVTKRVQFQYPIQDGDVIELQVDNGAGANWLRFTDRFSAFYSNDAQSVFYGASMSQQNSTQMNVNFYSATGGGGAWSSLSSFKWRVRKVSASSPVGFGLASSTASGLITKEATQTTFTVSDTGKVNLTGTGAFGTCSYVRQGNLITCNIQSITGYSVTSSANARTYVLLTPVGLPGTTAEWTNTMAGTCWVANLSDQGLTGRVSYASVDRIIVEFTSNSVLGTGLHVIYNIRFSYFVA